MSVTEPAPRTSRPWTARRAIAVVASSLGLLVGAALLLGALSVLAAHAFLRDDDGYYSSPSERFTTTANALTAEGVELWNVGGDGGWLAERVGGRVRVRVRGTADAPVFVGIAAERALDRWLSGVAHDEVTDVRFGPFSFDAVRRQGTNAPGRPQDQALWVASATGAGSRSIDWELDDGRWSLVVMNADGRAPVSADVSVGVKTGIVVPLGLGMLGAGLILVVAAGAGLWLSLRERA